MDKEFVKVLGEMLDDKLDKKLEPIRNEISSIKGEINGIKGEINSIKGEIQIIKEQQEEHGHILRILEDKVTVNKADYDKIMNDIAHLSNKVEGMRKDITALEIITARNMENIAYLKRARE